MPRKPMYGPELWAEIQAARRHNRNRQILHHLAHGLTVDEIAELMHYSPWTIRWNIKWMFLETGAHNRAHLMGWAYRTGVLPLEAS